VATIRDKLGIGIAIAVAPYDPNVVLVGGVNVWRSDDAGVNWNLNAHWTGSGAPYVHADIHDLIFEPATTGKYFVGCDGGIFNTTDDGANFSDLSNNLCIAQCIVATFPDQRMEPLFRTSG